MSDETPWSKPAIVPAEPEPSSIAPEVRSRWAAELAQDAPARPLREILSELPRPSLLAIVGTAHAVLVAVTFVYVLTTFGTIWALGLSVAYTLIWTVVLTNRADERGRLSRAPAPFRRYVPPKDGDDE